ncbi:MAG: AraC family transcriptional regulator, partial [Clostridia bacterium]|nr:AraC family transcriptional regulator [Clostridia bacterium]
DEKEYLLCHLESGMGWTYYAKIPKTALLSSFDSLKFLLIYSSIIFIILTFIISIYFSNKNSKPLKEIILKIQALKLLKQYPKRENEYNLIDNALVNLSNANIALRTTVENQTPIIVSNFYKQLIEGFFKTEKEYSSYTSFLNIDSSPDYVMEIIYIEGLESMVSEDLLKEANVIKAIIKDNFQQSNFKPLYYYDMNENSFAVIFSFSPYSQAVKTQLEAFQKNVKDKVLDEYNTLIYFSQSNKTNNLLEIHSLFNQAKQAIEQIKFNQTGYMVYYSHIPKDKDNFYYPIELELELIGLIKSGETEALKSKLKEIFCENFKSRSLSTEKTFQLVNLMKGSVLREFRQKLKNDNLKNLIANLENTNSTDEIFNLIVRIKTAYSNMISSIKEKKKTDLRNDIILFIEKNYRDPNFSIIEAANHFNRSEAFMYQFFKDNFSHSFYSYLENLRIKAACGLILQGKLTIKEISSKTGYSNDTTFRRAFKRIMHVTPTTYKNAVE